MTTDGDSPRAYRLGRQAMRQVATIVTPDSLLRWHRQLIAPQMDLRRDLHTPS
jgi:hypothetical protein